MRIIEIIVVLLIVIIGSVHAQCPWNDAPRDIAAQVLATQDSTKCPNTTSPGGRALVSWSGFSCVSLMQPNCEIEFFEYCIDDNETEPCIPNNRVYPANTAVAITGTGFVYVDNLPWDERLYANVWAFNCMGYSGTRMSNGFTLTAPSPPDSSMVLLTLVASPECSNPRIVDATWIGFTGVNPLTDWYEYCVSPVQDTCSAPDATWTRTAAMTATFTVSSGFTYYFSVRAHGCGGYSNIVSKSIEISEPQAPTGTGTVTLIGSYAPPNCEAQISATWVFNFLPYENAQWYEYCISTNEPHSCNFRDVEKTTTPIMNPISSLESNKTYYVSVRLANCAGRSEWFDSNGVYIEKAYGDNSTCCVTPPIGQTASIDISEEDPCQTPTRNLAVTVSNMVGYNIEYEYCLFEDPETPPQYCEDESIKISTSPTFVIPGAEEGKSYQVVVRGKNCAGYTQWISSREYYLFPPTKPDSNSSQVIISRGPTSSRYCMEMLQVSWAGFTYSGEQRNIQYKGEYMYCIETVPNSCNFVPWTRTNATTAVVDVCGNQTFYALVKAMNCIGESEQVSAGPYLLNISDPQCENLGKIPENVIETTLTITNTECNDDDQKIIDATVDIKYNSSTPHQNYDQLEYCIQDSSSNEICNWKNVTIPSSLNTTLTISQESGDFNVFMRVAVCSRVGEQSLVSVIHAGENDCKSSAATFFAPSLSIIVLFFLFVHLL